MKVMFVLNGLPHYFFKILEQIQKNNFEIVIITSLKTSKAIGKGVYQIDDHKSFKIYRTHEYTTWYRKPFFKNLKSILYQEKPNILITVWPYFLGFIFNPFLFYTLKKLKIKFVIREIPFQVAPFYKPIRYFIENPIYDEDLNYQNPHLFTNKIRYLLIALLRKISYSFADAGLSYIPEGYDIQGSYGIAKEKIFVTLNSPDTKEIFDLKSDLLKLNIQTIPYSAIHVGRLVKWKRVDLLINAYYKVIQKYPQAQLFIVGDGPEKNNLILQAKMLNITNNIIFCGSIYKYAELGTLFLKSQIYVLAGMGGLSINEAMAFGKPIICSICDGTEKILVKNQINGLFFKEGSTEDLAEKILYLFSNPALIEFMSKESEKIIREQVNIDIVTSNYINAFKKIATY